MVNTLKKHNMYRKLSINTVSELKLICRKNRECKWYALKKNELISRIILNYCSLVITRLFKRTKCYKECEE